MPSSEAFRPQKRVVGQLQNMTNLNNGLLQNTTTISYRPASAGNLLQSSFTSSCLILPLATLCLRISAISLHHSSNLQLSRSTSSCRKAVGKEKKHSFQGKIPITLIIPVIGYLGITSKPKNSPTQVPTHEVFPKAKHIDIALSNVYSCR